MLDKTRRTLEWNVMPLLLGGSIGIFFVAFYFAQLEVTVPLAHPTQEGGNKGSNTFSKIVALIV